MVYLVALIPFAAVAAVGRDVWRKDVRPRRRPLLDRPMTPRAQYAHADAIAAMLARHEGQA